MLASVLEMPLYRIAKFIQFCTLIKLLLVHIFVMFHLHKISRKLLLLASWKFSSPQSTSWTAPMWHLNIWHSLEILMEKKSEAIIFHCKNSFFKYHTIYFNIYRNTYKFLHVVAWETQPRSGFFFIPRCIHTKRFSVPVQTSFQFE